MSFLHSSCTHDDDDAQWDQVHIGNRSTKTRVQSLTSFIQTVTQSSRFMFILAFGVPYNIFM